MNWQQAFVRQAKSDYAVLKKLSEPGLADAHRLHYLQMVTEKLSKGMFQCGPKGQTEPPHGHTGFVKMLRHIKGQPQMRRALKFTDHESFARYINSLLDIGMKIEKLAPDLAGQHGPNPEYPWEDKSSGNIVAPFLFSFLEFNPKNSKMVKVESLIRDLLFIFQ